MDAVWHLVSGSSHVTRMRSDCEEEAELRCTVIIPKDILHLLLIKYSASQAMINSNKQCSFVPPDETLLACLLAHY